MRLIWTQEALERLEDIKYYLAVDQGAPQAAQDTIKQLLARTPQIEAMPLSGREVPNYNDPSLREQLVNPYRIIYSVDTAQGLIIVLSIMHQRQLLPKVKEMQAAAQASINAVEQEH